MSDTGVDAGRTLAEELDYMGRRTTDPEASDLLIQAAQEVESLQAEIATFPCCLRWGTLIPSIDGPYGPGWEAHNNCSPIQHGWFTYRAPSPRPLHIEDPLTPALEREEP